MAEQITITHLEVTNARLSGAGGSPTIEKELDLNLHIEATFEDGQTFPATAKVYARSTIVPRDCNFVIRLLTVEGLPKDRSINEESLQRLAAPSIVELLQKD